MGLSCLCSYFKTQLIFELSYLIYLCSLPCFELRVEPHDIQTSLLFLDSMTQHLKMPKHRHMDCRALSRLARSQTLDFEALQDYFNNHKCQAVMAEVWLCCFAHVLPSMAVRTEPVDPVP